MQRHGYAYRSAVATDAPRVTINPNEIVLFYTRTLPEAINGAHLSLVFNMDEMGAEMYADRKRVNAFVPAQEVHENGPMTVGIPRTSRRCTLVAGICLDGTTLPPAVITKTFTISSAVFEEGGSSPNDITFHTTKNSFINNDVFGKWLCVVFVPEIERKRDLAPTTARRL